MPALIDHLIYATPDLEATVDDLARRFGVRATAGGSHPGEGTRNALYSLGPGCYLEIMAPDPDQPPPDQPRWLGIDDLGKSRLVTWAARPDDFDATVELARSSAIRLGKVLSGGRERPDGSRLTWRLTDPREMPATGILPFFIDWGNSPHPSESSAVGLRLVSFHGEHPDPTAIQHVADRLELPLTVSKGPTARLIATLESPKGLVRLS